MVQGEAVVTREAEFAGPGWMFGSRSYQVLPDGRSAEITPCLLETPFEVSNATPFLQQGCQWARLACHQTNSYAMHSCQQLSHHTNDLYSVHRIGAGLLRTI